MRTTERNEGGLRDERSVLLIAAIAALSAGLAFATSDLLRPIFPTVDDVACDTWASYAINVADLVKFVAIGLAVLMIARHVRGRITRLARRVAIIGAVASIVTGIANAVEHCAHLEAVGLVYVSSLIMGLVATAWFGFLLARTQETMRWTGRAIALGTLALWFGAEQGWGRPADAIMWIAIGVVLMRQRSHSPGSADPSAA